jgi:hypothetical protein
MLVLSLLFIERHAASDQVITVATRPRVTLAVVVVRPPAKPAATVVVLVGGAGRLDLTPRGSRETHPARS